MKLSKSKHARTILTQYPTMPVEEVAKRANCGKSIVYNARYVLNLASTPVNKKLLAEQTVTVKDAIEVLAHAVSVVDGLDIKVWDAAVLFEYDGARYSATANTANQVLDAIKLLASNKFD